MEGYRRKPRRHTVHRKVCGVQDRSKRKERKKGKASAKKQGEGGGILVEIYGGSREEIGRKTYLHGPMNY